jgi:hypothetical protein
VPSMACSTSASKRTGLKDYGFSAIVTVVTITLLSAVDSIMLGIGYKHAFDSQLILAPE